MHYHITHTHLSSLPILGRTRRFSWLGVHVSWLPSRRHEGNQHTGRQPGFDSDDGVEHLLAGAVPVPSSDAEVALDPGDHLRLRRHDPGEEQPVGAARVVLLSPSSWLLHLPVALHVLDIRPPADHPPCAAAARLPELVGEASG